MKSINQIWTWPIGAVGNPGYPPAKTPFYSKAGSYIAVLATLIAPCASYGESKLYVTNLGSNNISVIDTAANGVTNTIPGPGPGIVKSIAYNPKNNLIYLSTEGASSQIRFIDPTTDSFVGSPISISLGSNPINMSISPDLNRNYVSVYDGGGVSVIDTVANTVIANIATGFLPVDSAFFPELGKAYVANNGDGNVSVIDMATSTVIKSTDPLGVETLGVGVDTVAGKAVVTLTKDAAVVLIDAASDTVVATLTGLNCPNFVAVDSAKHRAYVTYNISGGGSSNPCVNLVEGRIAVIDTLANTIVKTFPVGVSLSRLELNASENRLYLPDRATNSVFVVDTATDSVLSEIPVGIDPIDIAIGPLVTVANAGTDLTVNEGTAGVALDGSQSSGSQPFTYQWQQLGVTPGDPLEVALSGADTAAPTFQAPTVTQNQTLTFQLTVTDSDGASASDTVNVTVVNVNHEPVAVPGPHGYYPGCSGSTTTSVREGAQGSLDGRCSYDPDDDALTYAWTQPGGTAVTWAPAGQTSATPQFTVPLSLGEALTFNLTVNDGQVNSVPVDMSVEVVSNSAPTADAGTGQAVDENTLVTLAGTASDSDAEDVSALTYSWQQVGGSPVTVANDATLTPSFTAPWVAPGGEDFTFLLTVNDNYAPNPKSASDQVTVHVNNVNDPPTCNLAQSSVASLWPPNHKLLPVNIRNVVGADDTLTITGVTQDEAVNGLGDGDTAPDAVIEGANVLLRAERSGTGDGRVYRVTFSATDAEGSCAGSVTVSVPRDNKKPAVDSGQTVDSTQP